MDIDRLLNFPIFVLLKDIGKSKSKHLHLWMDYFQANCLPVRGQENVSILEFEPANPLWPMMTF